MEALLEGMQRNGQGSSGFLTSCEAELQELMKQIDIMVAHKKSEWEGQTQALEAALSAREQELASAKAALQDKHKEVELLRRQVKDVEKSKQDMVREYEQQLKKFQEELSRLRRSYEKLQKKKTRSRGEANRGQEEDKFELSRLTRKLEVLQDEKMELRATLQSQEDFIDSSKLHQEQLQKELARMTETLHTKEALIRALEERLQGKQPCTPGLELEQALLQLGVAQRKEQHLQSEVARLENSLVSSNARCVQLSKELGENIKELQSLEEDQAESRAEIKKLKEQLCEAEQMHSSELAGLKREVCRLTQELQRRDVALAAASGSAAHLRQRLRAEMDRAERKAVQHGVILVQLETLKLENQHLSEILEKTECAKLEGAAGTPRALGEDCAAELQQLQSEQQQLQRDLAESRAGLGLPVPVCPAEPGGTAQQGQGQEPQARAVQHRTAQEAQHEQDEHAEIHLQPSRAAQHPLREPQGGGAAGTGAVSPERGEPASQSSRESCEESCAWLGAEPLLPVADENKDFADEAPKQAASNHHRESVSLCPLPTASVGAIAARYLEDEEVRSQHILECLNAHIEELKKESAKIVRRFEQQE